jgi:hypothetical protein
MLELGKLAGVDAPVTESLVTIASTINAIDYRQVGLNAEKMGLKGMSKGDAQAYFHLG